jgi:glycosyltransferase involved in cell wall biosynthesis
MAASVKVRELSVVMPVWNEEAVVLHSVTNAVESLPQLSDSWELIVVDDGSLDSTGKLLAALDHPSVKILTLERHVGYWPAIRRGIDSARYSIVGYVDGDSQFDLMDMGGLLEQIGNFDIVSGYRNPRKDDPHRLALSFLYNRSLKVGAALGVRDVNCAMKVFHRGVWDALKVEGAYFTGVAEFMLVAQHAGMRIGEVGVRHYPRENGKSKVRPVDLAFGAWDLLRLLIKLRLKDRL